MVDFRSFVIADKHRLMRRMCLVSMKLASP